MAEVSVIGIDTAKSTFEVCSKTEQGRVIQRKKLHRDRVVEFLAQQPQGTVIAMEACGGTNHWGRECLKLGLVPRLIAPQFVKPYVKSNKSNRADAEAIAEAAQRPTMRFVSVKTLQQQDTLAAHRVRSRLVKQRTALINEMRGLLHEYGVVMQQGAKRFRADFCRVLEENKERLTPKALSLFNDLYSELRAVDERVKGYDDAIEREVKEHPIARKLLDEIPAIGELTASALVAITGDPKQFKNGRQFAAWLGLVPRQHSTGDKHTLLGISKRGDRYVRTLLIHGARNVVQHAHKYSDRRSTWTTALAKRRGRNKATVALANKTARVAWILMMNPDSKFDRNHVPERYKKAA